MTDAELIIKAREGDSESFGLLYARHKGWVYGYALSHLGNVENAVDTVQEVFLRALKGLPRLQSEESFGAWLNGITRHVVTDYLRRYYQRKEGLNTMLDEANNLDTLPAFPPPDQVVVDTETVAQILAGLNNHYQILIRLRLLEGLSSGEVANQLYGADSEENRRKVTVGLYKAMQAARQLVEHQQERV